MINDTSVQQLPAKPNCAIPRGIRIIKRYTISKPFRNLLAECLPGLNRKPAYWDFVGYLLFGCQNDEDTGSLMLWKETLAKVTDNNPKNFYAIDFLRDFQTEVMSPETFAWTLPNAWKKKCRHVERCEWPERIREALPAEFAKARHREGRVYFDGSVFTAGRLRQQRIAERKDSERLPALCPDAQMIQDYMNTRASNLFTETVSKNYQHALSVAQSLKPGRSSEQQVLMLSRIYDQAQPFYSATKNGNTMRLYSSNAIPNLQSDVRRALTPSWPEADLANCQLAICATLWSITPILEFLKQDQKSIWSHLGDVVGIPEHLREATKGILKDLLYTTCYGKSRLKVKNELTEALSAFGVSNGGERFVQDELVASLFAARDAKIKKIRAAGGDTDCYGRWIPTGNGRYAHDLLAEVAQSYEMSLIAPIFELARETKEFQVMIYQFDGISVHFGRPEKDWRGKINDVVSNKAQKLGIITRLKWKD